MLIRTRIVYAVNMVLFLAKYKLTSDTVSSTGSCPPVKASDISHAEGIPLAYLEQLSTKLRRAGIIDSVRGPGGGYRVVKSLHDITILDIIGAIDGNIEMLQCSKCNELKPNLTPHSKCNSHSLWANLTKTLDEFFSSTTLHDIVSNNNVSLCISSCKDRGACHGSKIIPDN